MVAYLEKLKGSAEFHHIIDFLTTSHIHYALTENPTIYASFIKQFWTTATSSTNVNGEVELTASIVWTKPRQSLKHSFKKTYKLCGQWWNYLFYLSQRYLKHLLLMANQKSEDSWKSTQVRQCSRRTKIVLSKDDIVEEDSSKQGRSLIEELDMDANISLVPPHAKIQEKISDETEVLLEEEEATEIVQDQGSVCALLLARSAGVYIRRSEKKKKDKGKAILIEDESVQKKSKKKVQEERLGYEEAIRLQEQINKEERKRIAEEYDKGWERKEAMTEVDTAQCR
ncbi:hypothetical protein Tco_0804027 [Tanacetum coccineum]|uniref:Uncharacterized protein n=1 Tax=Tanacetum coccineum TaxID=301880 RepID=A0ABQ5A377_9ASTR